MKKVVISIIAIMLIVSAFIGIYQLKKKQREETIHADYVEKQQEMFDQLEELFYLQKDNMQVVVDELLLIDEFNDAKVLDSEGFYMIIFDEFPEGQDYNYASDFIVFNYNDGTFLSKKAGKELFDKLNTNTVLKDALDELKNSQMVEGVYVSTINSSVTINFGIPAEVAPFIPSNTGAPHYFIYCKEQDLEKYGYGKTENNWYMKIIRIMEE